METVIPNEHTTEVEYPSLSDRVQSTFIDAILMIILMMIFASVLNRYENAPNWVRAVFFIGIWGIYEPVCTAFGFTIGNYLKGIRVRSASNPDKRINFIQALFRYLLKFSLGWISFLTMHTNPQRRAIHDFAAGSVMMRVGRR